MTTEVSKMLIIRKALEENTFRNKERLQIKTLLPNSRKLKKSKASKRKEIMKIRPVINEIETRNTTE